MKKLLILLLILAPFTPNVFAESVVNTSSILYPELKTQIDDIFVSLANKLSIQTPQKQISIYETLKERVQKIQESRPNLSPKNSFILSYILTKTQESIDTLQSDEINIGSIFEGLGSE